MVIDGGPQNADGSDGGMDKREKDVKEKNEEVNVSVKAEAIEHKNNEKSRQ